MTNKTTTPTVVTSNEVPQADVQILPIVPTEETTQTDVKGFAKSTGKEIVLEVKASDVLKKETVGNGCPTPTFADGLALVQCTKHLLKVTDYDDEENYPFGTYGSYVNKLAKSEAYDGFEKPFTLNEALQALGLPIAAIVAFKLQGNFVPYISSKENVLLLKNSGFTETEARKLVGCSARMAQDVYRPNLSAFSLSFIYDKKGVPTRVTFTFEDAEKKSSFAYKTVADLIAGCKAANVKFEPFLLSLGGTIQEVETKVSKVEEDLF